MITYGFSIQGKGHIQRGIVCQDSSIADRIQSGHYVGIVADGVGSARHADIGSGIAVKSLFQYCNEHIQKNTSADRIEDILADGYAFAFGQIEREAKRLGEAVGEFDTTLSAVVYNRQTVVYGHSGDGGIIAKYADGKIAPLSSRQKGADGTSVIPLRGGRGSWVFGAAENVAAVLLVTDGMLDGVIQPSLINLPPNRIALARGDFRRDHVYVTAAEFFMNPYSVYRNKSVKDPDEYMRYFLQGELDGSDQKTFLQCILTAYVKQLGKEGTARVAERIQKYFYAVWAVSQVTDDKSVVCIMDEKASVRAQDIGYYEEPEWEMLKEKYEIFLYGKKRRKPVDEDLPGSGTGEQEPPEPEQKPPEKIGDDDNEKDTEKSKINRIRTKLPAVLISLAVGCVLGSLITLFLTSVFIKTPDKPDPPVMKRPVAGQNSTKAPEDVTDFRKDAEKFLECLLRLDVSNLSKADEERLRDAISEYRFQEYMKILKDEKNSTYGKVNKSDEADAKTVDGSVNELIQIIKKISEETSRKEKAEEFKSELIKIYDSFDPEDRNKISLVQRQLSH